MFDGVPAERLPGELPLVWERALGRSALGGVAATADVVVFGDRDLDEFHDVFHCLDAATGEPRWRVQSLAIAALDYGNSPRATPLIDGPRVFLLGATGDLHCVALDTGETHWKRNLRRDFGFLGDLPWGYCGSPLLVDGKLIVQPGAADASLVALDPATGAVIWKSPGGAPSYGSLIVATLGGVRQIVGHDAASLGGWDLATGRRLWSLAPAIEGDFNVPTPQAIDGRLLIATENNGARLFAFQAEGRIDPTPVALQRRLAPDMSTPVVVGRRLFCVNKFLYCLDLDAGLRERWRQRDPAWADYGAAIASPNRLLAFGKGEALVVDPHADDPRVLARWRLFDEQVELFAHPAVVGDRLYVRGESSLRCFALPTP